MKQLIFFLLLCVTLFRVQAQTTISITTDKTSSLVFSNPILHVDRGAKAILVQGIKDAPHILLVKAATKNFSETNLSVVTVDGSLYSFAVRYHSQPEEQVYHVAAKKSSPLQNYATGILDNPRTINGIRDSKWDMAAEITGIYVQSDILYFQLHLTNNSPIDFEPELMRLFIRDRKKAKRTALQEQELPPLLVTANPGVIKAMTSYTMVIAVQKVTIPDAKQMLFQLMEKNGGRHLQLKISNKKLMQSILLPDYAAKSNSIP
ncbi:conjugative transposon TraN protein [Lacibacter cauensis]|uniref:Conjugative transposon TraN protein n=1 Tax=Lacibacter cauensis TaxID=510947 RepID=A0A562S9D8_9BACT|nr:conjugative transposon protein TraN [Lacibacter cauensis]TWI77997.1 conjugative transposon TraN protein [Lacibacter cauensis]